jgi:prepilin-type N-terminal cleavage/methylation domain-containing protein
MRNRRAGFTIIEVAIVCVLIGLLTLIALPALTSHREKAQKATMKSDLHQLVLAQETALMPGYGVVT